MQPGVSRRLRCASDGAVSFVVVVMVAMDLAAARFRITDAGRLGGLDGGDSDGSSSLVSSSGSPMIGSDDVKSVSRRLRLGMPRDDARHEP